MTSRSIEVKPLAGALGAEVSNVDLSAPLSNQVRDEIHQAYLNHLVIVFRDQDLTPQKQTEIAQIFGKPAIYPFLQGIDGAPEVNELLKTEQDTVNFGGSWHSDTAYKEHPDMGTLLYALEVPETGGDTQFTNMYLAYEALSGGMKKMLEGLTAIYSSEKGYSGKRAERMKSLGGLKDLVVVEVESFESEHPVVRTHPETGRKGLYISKSHTLRFADMTVEESTPLIDYLSTFAVRPEFTFRLQWEPRTLTIWDNRCTKHFAIDDYAGKRRRMHRVTIEGDRPC
jgi:taurine dioxygenase